MGTGCDHFRSLIPRAMLADLDPAEQRELDLHLAECAPCAGERELYAQTLGRMRSLEDVPVPRHFLVYPEQRQSNPWRLFRSLTPVWQGSLAAGILILFLVSAAAATRIQVGTRDGALVLAFGGALPAETKPVPAARLDTTEMEARIARIVEEKNRKEELEWIRKLRAELAQSQRGFTRNQRTLLEAALGTLETRVNARVDETARTLDERRAQSLTALYQAIKLQQDSGLALVDAKLNRLAINGEKKNSEIDAILDTILQVADLNTTQLPGEKR